MAEISKIPASKDPAFLPPVVFITVPFKRLVH